jgi:hypothetical protein
MTVPTGAQYVNFSATSNFYANFTTTATVPGDVTDGSTVKTIEGVSFGNLGDGNTAGLFEVNQSYNPTTLTTTSTSTETVTTTGVAP